VLESNSIHAMHRSDLIAKTLARYGASRFEARYQIEILCVLLYRGTWDGFQVREVGAAGEGEVWFPALTIPSHGKAFAAAWGGAEDWISFWQLNFAQPLGRAKAEMLAYFGLQHMTANAQNMLIVFDRTRSTGLRKSKHVTLRDLGDTLYNDHLFAILNKIHSSYKDAWDHEVNDTDNGVTLTSNIGGGYSNPEMTRLGASIVFFFPPFVQGDLKSENTAKVLASWGIAHNRAFAQYWIENTGYSRFWEDGTTTVESGLAKELRTYAGFATDIRKQYSALVKKVLALKAADRWALIADIEGEVDKLEKDAIAEAKGLVDAHDMLICADIECYVKSKAGAVGVTALHKKTSPDEGLVCSSCGGKHGSKRSSSWGRWHRCKGCGKLWCNVCAKWWLWRPAWFTEERKCPSCGGTTGLID